MTTLVLMIVAVLVGSHVQAGPIPDVVQAELDLLEQGYNKAYVPALEAEVEQNPSKQAYLDEFKAKYNKAIGLIKKLAGEGKIVEKTFLNHPEYQDVKTLIQNTINKGKLGVSSDEVVQGIKDGVQIADGIMVAFGPILHRFG